MAKNIKSELPTDASCISVETAEEAALIEQHLIYCGVDEAGAGPLCGDCLLYTSDAADE